MSLNLADNFDYIRRKIIPWRHWIFYTFTFTLIDIFCIKRHSYFTCFCGSLKNWPQIFLHISHGEVGGSIYSVGGACNCFNQWRWHWLLTLDPKRPCSFCLVHQHTYSWTPELPFKKPTVLRPPYWEEAYVTGGIPVNSPNSASPSSIPTPGARHVSEETYRWFEPVQSPPAIQVLPAETPGTTNQS